MQPFVQNAELIDHLFVTLQHSTLEVSIHDLVDRLFVLIEPDQPAITQIPQSSLDLFILDLRNVIELVVIQVCVFIQSKQWLRLVKDAYIVQSELQLFYRYSNSISIQVFLTFMVVYHYLLHFLAAKEELEIVVLVFQNVLLIYFEHHFQ